MLNNHTILALKAARKLLDVALIAALLSIPYFAATQSGIIEPSLTEKYDSIMRSE